MGLWSKGDVARGEELIDLLLGCDGRAPIAEIEQVIRLAQKTPAVRKRVLEVLDSWVCDGGSDLQACWFGAVAGELGREGLALCVEGLGRGEEDLVDEVLLPVVQHHILDVLDLAIRRLHQAEEAGTRMVLYEAIEAALVVGNDTVKERLRTFALERWEVEKADPEAVSVLDQPLSFLIVLGDPRSRDRLSEARKLCRSNKLALADLNDLEAALRGEMDLLEVVRSRQADDWKATLRNLEVLVGWREPDGGTTREP